MDIFSKCSTFTLARECRERGVYPYFHALGSRQDTVVTMDGARRIMLGSNNYLGLTIHPQVVAGGGGRALPPGHGVLRLPLPQRHADHAPGAGERAGRLPAQGRLCHLLHRLSVQSGHHQRPRGPRRLCCLRPREPRQHLRRLPPLPGPHAPLQAQRHGQPGGEAEIRAPGRGHPHRHRRRFLHGRRHRPSAGDFALSPADTARGVMGGRRPRAGRHRRGRGAARPATSGWRTGWT